MKTSSIIFFNITFYCAVFTIICLIRFDFLPNSYDNAMQTCSRYPKSEHILIDNIYWQVLEHSRGIVDIFNAYLDLRQNNSVVRINVSVLPLNSSYLFHCQFWNDEKSFPRIVQSSDITQSIWRK